MKQNWSQLKVLLKKKEHFQTILSKIFGNVFQFLAYLLSAAPETEADHKTMSLWGKNVHLNLNTAGHTTGHLTGQFKWKFTRTLQKSNAIKFHKRIYFCLILKGFVSIFSKIARNLMNWQSIMFSKNRFDVYEMK